MIKIPGYAKPPSYFARNISLTPAGNIEATNVQDAAEELDNDLIGGLSSKLPYSYGTATPSTTDSGFLWYDSNSTPAAPKFWDGAAFQTLTSGKILQIVRTTDTTQRSTTSTSYVDVPGMSVSITPQKSNSIILVLTIVYALTSTPSGYALGNLSITNSSNIPLSGAEIQTIGSQNSSGPWYHNVAMMGYSTPSTMSAVTYKLRFSSQNTSNEIAVRNNLMTGQMYAIEVSA